MNKIAVVYRSKSGFTQKYAQWIAQAVGADLLPAKGVRLNDLMAYDTIVYGGALYAAGINGIRLITKNFEKLKNKKLIVFTLGATPVRPEIVEQVRNANLTADQQAHIRFFMLRGGFDKSKLRAFDNVLMALLKIKLKGIKNPDADQRGMLAAYDHPADFTNEKRIAPIVAAIRES